MLVRATEATYHQANRNRRAALHKHGVVASNKAHEPARQCIAERYSELVRVRQLEEDRLLEIDFLDIAAPVARGVRLVQLLRDIVAERGSKLDWGKGRVRAMGRRWAGRCLILLRCRWAIRNGVHVCAEAVMSWHARHKHHRRELGL